MNVSFERTANTTDEWYTPKYILDSLGKFDLDPCAPSVPLYQTAGTMYNEFDDGLAQKWEGRVCYNRINCNHIHCMPCERMGNNFVKFKKYVTED